MEPFDCKKHSFVSIFFIGLAFLVSIVGLSGLSIETSLNDSSAQTPENYPIEITTSIRKIGEDGEGMIIGNKVRITTIIVNLGNNRGISNVLFGAVLSPYLMYEPYTTTVDSQPLIDRTADGIIKPITFDNLEYNRSYTISMDATIIDNVRLPLPVGSTTLQVDNHVFSETTGRIIKVATLSVNKDSKIKLGVESFARNITTGGEFSKKVGGTVGDLIEIKTTISNNGEDDTIHAIIGPTGIIIDNVLYGGVIGPYLQRASINKYPTVIKNNFESRTPETTSIREDGIIIPVNLGSLGVGQSSTVTITAVISDLQSYYPQLPVGVTDVTIYSHGVADNAARVIEPLIISIDKQFRE